MNTLKLIDLAELRRAKKREQKRQWAEKQRRAKGTPYRGSYTQKGKEKPRVEFKRKAVTVEQDKPMYTGNLQGQVASYHRPIVGGGF